MGMTVKEMRDFLELSQSQFAKKFGLSVHTVQSWEQKARNISGYTFNMMNKIVAYEASDGYVSNLTAYNMLCNVFDEDDIIVNQCFTNYGICAFYIKSRNLLIDLKNEWFHMEHWFNAETDETANVEDIVADAAIVNKWIDYEYYNPIYSRAILEWTELDVKQRKWLKKVDANYVVFWQEDLSDLYDWINMGCPDGKDWLYEYSWLDNVDIMQLLNNPAYLVYGHDFLNMIEFCDGKLIADIRDKSENITDWQKGQICYEQRDENDERCLTAYYSETLSGFVIGTTASTVFYTFVKE